MKRDYPLSPTSDPTPVNHSRAARDNTSVKKLSANGVLNATLGNSAKESMRSYNKSIDYADRRYVKNSGSYSGYMRDKEHYKESALSDDKKMQKLKKNNK